jgi:hypothetical protein
VAKLSTDDLFKELYATVSQAGQCLRYWRAFNDPKHVKERTRIMDAYPIFFATARPFLTTVIVDLYRLYDTVPNTVTIPALYKRVVDEGQLKRPASLPKAAVAIAKAKPLWKGVCILRHKVFAHRDDGGDVNLWFKLAGVSPHILFALHSRSKRALNELSYARDANTYAFNLEGLSEFTDLLEDIGRARHRRA